MPVPEGSGESQVQLWLRDEWDDVCVYVCACVYVNKWGESACVCYCVLLVCACGWVSECECVHVECVPFFLPRCS